MKMPLSRALIFIFLSIIVISGPAFLGLLYYQSLINNRSADDRYLVRRVISSSAALPLDYICELLDLSYDQPTNLYLLNKQEMERKLLSSPLIERAYVKKMPPDRLWIDYIARKPIALLGGYKNTAIDQKGFVFPFTPFFTGLELPTFYLGEQKNGFRTAVELEKRIRSLNLSLSHINVSHMNEKSLGKREIVVALNEGNHQFFLRLTPDNYKEELSNFQRLKENVPSNGTVTVVDLRIPEMAFLQSN